MAGSVNKVILVGNLGKDPETRAFPNGGKVVSFTLATSERWKNKETGEYQDKVEWHNISVLNERHQNFAEKYLKKGSKAYLEGQVRNREYKDPKNPNENRYITEIVLSPFGGELLSLDPRDKDQAEPASSKPASASAKATSTAPATSATARTRRPAVEDEGDDDEVAF